MSVSSINAAKKRRTEIIASPMFKNANMPMSKPVVAQMNTTKINTAQINTAQTNNLVQQQQPFDPKKPMPLQQVITLFDNRILYLENHLVKISNEQVNVVPEKNETSILQLSEQDIQKTVESSISEHITEFDHRYELLANEIVNIKQIVLTLQSYTFDVNKTLLEEREQLLTLLNMHAQTSMTDVETSMTDVETSITDVETSTIDVVETSNITIDIVETSSNDDIDLVI